MDFNEYKEFAEKTLSTQFHSTPQLERLLHASLGLATEIEELLENYVNGVDPTNLLEEVGDIYWYLSIFYREFPEIQIIPKQRVSKEPQDLVMNILKSILKIQDLIKKKLYYNKIIDETTLHQLVYEVESDLRMYLNLYSISVEDVWDKNIAKLKARYGDKFSSEKAINRDLETERKILEN